MNKKYLWFLKKIPHEKKNKIKTKKKQKKKKTKSEQKIYLLAEKPTCFWREITSSFSLKKDSPIETKGFFFKKKCVYNWRVNAVKIFPNAQNGLGWMHKLIKEHIFETPVWFKIGKMNPEP